VPHTCTFEHWRNLVLAAIVCFYLIMIVATLARDGAVGDDFVAYWSVGRISDEKGFSQIYELDNLAGIYSHELRELGYFFDLDVITYSVPYLPFFVLPFYFLSRIDLPYSFWIWNILNFLILFAYLVFFLQRIKPGKDTAINGLFLLVVGLISFPVFKNFHSGNVNVFLLVCAGEFIRHAVNKKPFLSGMWLGGLLLKPPLLILIIPIFLITRKWKVLKGFFVSFGIILFASIILAGFSGMTSLINLWIGYPGDTFSNTAPEYMINWRMVGFILDNQLNMSIGWAIIGLGIIFTLFALTFHKKHIMHFGTPTWVIAMLAVFSATIAISWHSHFYTAMVLIPFLIYASVHKLFPEKIIFLWGIVTPVVWFGTIIIGLFVYFFLKIFDTDFMFMVITLSGFAINLLVLYYTTIFNQDHVSIR
jgi:hypothetical protein